MSLCPRGTKIQTLVFDSSVFTEVTAKRWAHSHNLKYRGVDVRPGSYRIRQRDPGRFEASSYRTIELAHGVQAVIGRPKVKTDRELQRRLRKLGI